MALPNCLRTFGVAQRGLVRSLSHAQAKGGDGDAAAVENLQAVDEAVAFDAHEILGGHAAVGENEFAGVAGAQAELVFLLAGTKAGGSLLHDESRDAAILFGGVGGGDHHADIGIVAVGDEGLRAVDDPTAVFLDGSGARASCVRAGFGFGERPAAQLLALRERRDVLLLLLFVAELVDVVGAQRIVRGDDDANGAVHARELFDDDGVLDVAHSRAAIFFREDDAEKTHFAELGNEFGGKLRGFVPLHDVRQDFGLGERADGAPELLLLVG